VPPPAPGPAAYSPPPTGAYVPTVGAPAQANNGMGIAALVLGIVSVVLFFACGAGILAGVLAVVFGFLGMGKAKQIDKGRGMSLAGMILGVVGVIGGILFLVLVTIGVNKASDNISTNLNNAFGSVDPSDYQLTTDTCKIDNSGTVEFTGTIKNKAGRDLDVIITGEIRNAKTNSLITTTTDTVSTTKGDTSDWSLNTVISNPVDITCKVTEVNNFLN
jgi:hypothetical protein